MTIMQITCCSIANCVMHGSIQRNKMRKWQRELAVKDAQTRMAEQCPNYFNGRLCGLPKGHLGGCIPYRYLRESDKHGVLCPCSTCFAERAKKFNGSVGE